MGYLFLPFLLIFLLCTIPFIHGCYVNGLDIHLTCFNADNHLFKCSK